MLGGRLIILPLFVFSQLSLPSGVLLFHSALIEQPYCAFTSICKNVEMIQYTHP